MTMMSAATDAVILGARQDQLIIGAGAEHAWNRREKTRPAGAAFVFHRRCKERQSTSRASENTWTFFTVQRAGARSFGPLFAQNLKLRGVQTPAPLVFGELERLGRCRRFEVLGKQRAPILLHVL